MSDLEGLQITSAQQDGVAILTMSGDLDIRNSDAAAEALAEPASPIVVDLRACRFMGSDGLNALLRARRVAIDREHRVVVVVEPGKAVDRLLDLTGTKQILNVCHELEEAIATASVIDRRAGLDRRRSS